MGTEPDSGTDEATVARTILVDQATANDSLGFEPYVAAIADFLTDSGTKPPLTLSVEGPWGSGKSSLLRQLENALSSPTRVGHAKYAVVHFNAWRHAAAEQLWAAFALETLKALKSRLPWYQRFSRWVWLAYDRFDWRNGTLPVLLFATLIIIFAFAATSTLLYVHDNGLPALVALLLNVQEKGGGAPPAVAGKNASVLALLHVAGVVAYLGVFSWLAQRLAKLVGNPFDLKVNRYAQGPDYQARRSFLETFQADVANMLKRYSGSDSRVYVFVDDLDRCEVPKAAELIEAMNLLIPEGPTPLVFVLAMDREKVAAGLAAKYERVLPYLAAGSFQTPPQPGDILHPVATAGIEFGYEFIERFVQLPFQVPQPTTNDIDCFLRKLNGVDCGPSNPERQQVSYRTRVDTGTDSVKIRDIVTMVAPSLEYNPRRIKQFLNVFRLRAYIADLTGLFADVDIGSDVAPLTLEQLGKFVAISLMWPRLLNDLALDFQLLSDLQAIALDEGVESRTPLVGYWRRRERLLALLRNSPAEDPDDMPTGYRVDRLDVEKLLRTSPRRASANQERDNGIQSREQVSGDGAYVTSPGLGSGRPADSYVVDVRSTPAGVRSTGTIGNVQTSARSDKDGPPSGSSEPSGPSGPAAPTGPSGARGPSGASGPQGASGASGASGAL